MLQLIECPRDAMQGWAHPIATDVKVAYLNQLLQVGFHTLDCGSFVSPKAIPQMADTPQVLAQLNMQHTTTKLLVIVANERGALEACGFDHITYIGFPFSVSPTFQQRNTNSTIEESWERVQRIQALCTQHGKTLVVYLSMAFGNPYGDAYDESVLQYWTEKMTAIGITIVSLADTVGVATPEQISTALQALIPAFPQAIIGVHLHSTALHWERKVQAAYQAGCQRFDGALKGIGGCPMAQNDLVGNMATENLLAFFKTHTHLTVNEDALQVALAMAGRVFV
ncbi:MAG TPA: hydroxymethylglutaryl-CoA lyase [Chitinophagaceae bacterium]|jgi:hydroxymethylglutaryl-CoA lyase|nr:hydroxymethylglutaryl-CoA lyase [Chitinophagaceae bacterium]